MGCCCFVVVVFFVFVFFKCDCCDCDLTGGLIMYMHLDYKLVCKMWACVGIELYIYILLVSCMSVVVSL